MRDQDWLSVKSFAAHLEVDPRTVRRWIRAGRPELEVLRIAGTVRVRITTDAIVRDCPHVPTVQEAERGAV